ncbi:MAG: TetR/AcrR family transcriptional regulator [Deltaproteobacteria bacterium]|nr:MAG: TetR/AcrR family transcriptional regulator [Deltaproteobacteria bacterium]
MARPRSDSIDVATPERILAAAEVAFAAQGLANARLADIARSAGLRRPSLLYHFKTKDVLYAAVVERCFARLGVGLATARAVEGDFEAKLRGVADAFGAFLDEEPHVAQIFVRELLDSDGPGGALLLERAAPLLDEMEAWIVASAGDRLRADLEVRVVLMHIASDALLRNCAGPLRGPLWGAPNPDRSFQIARTLLREVP